MVSVGIPTFASMKTGFHDDVTPRHLFSCRQRLECRLKESFRIYPLLTVHLLTCDDVYPDGVGEGVAGCARVVARVGHPAARDDQVAPARHLGRVFKD